VNMLSTSGYGKTMRPNDDRSIDIAKVNRQVRHEQDH
jgi:hypothetical protein